MKRLWNKMNLYRIRRKKDGRFFSGFQFGNEIKDLWGPSGTFWKTPEAVHDNLVKLGSEAYYYKPPGSMWERQGFKNFDPKKIEAYEVVVTNVSILKEERHPAIKFVRKDK